MPVSLMLILAGGIFFLIVLPGILWHTSALCKRKGPAGPVQGSPCARGKIICKSAKAPTLGRELKFTYEVKLTGTGKETTGTFSQKSYNGKIFLRHDGGQVQGRLEGRETKAFEGDLDGGDADVLLGYPKGSALSFLNGKMEFIIRDGTVHFFDTNNGQACIHDESEMQVTARSITGTLIHYRESWVADVELTFASLPPERAVLCMLLMGNAILDYHHD